jgi:hypothetical protein
MNHGKVVGWLLHAWDSCFTHEMKPPRTPSEGELHRGELRPDMGPAAAKLGGIGDQFVRLSAKLLLNALRPWENSPRL